LIKFLDLDPLDTWPSTHFKIGSIDLTGFLKDGLGKYQHRDYVAIPRMFSAFTLAL